MQASKRFSLGLSALLSVGLIAVLVRDVYLDAWVEGKPLWSTVAENAVPLLLAASLFAAGYLVARRRGRAFLRSVTRWQYLGAAGIFLVAAEVVGLQALQGDLKPGLLVVQLTVGGAAAGTLVGIATARSARAQREAERERDKFEALYENAPAEAVELRLTGDEPVVVETNAAFEEMFGTDPASVTGQSLFDVVHHDDAIRQQIREAIGSGSDRELLAETATDSGRREFQLRVVPFSTEPRAYLLYTDVSELERARERLSETVDRLERSNERLQQFAYVASHDLQEPARMVSSYVTLLDDEYGDQLDEEAREYIDFAADGATRMQEMIDSLLDYSRVSTRAEEFAEVDVDDVLADTLQNLELLVEDHDATVTTEPMPTVEADRNQLGQVFQNLLENALEHGGDGVEIHVGVEKRDAEYVFSVADDGPGVQAERPDRIFEIFEQGNRDNEGTGMGLAICERIVSRHGGDIRVESEPGEGATFYFSVAR
jgi:PAS domain S-box-containing protein